MAPHETEVEGSKEYLSHALPLQFLSDAGAIGHSVTAPVSSATFTANFTAQYPPDTRVTRRRWDGRDQPGFSGW